LRIPQFIAVAWLMLLCALSPVHAERRVALVVGNGAYLHADKLANPVNDARGVRDALKRIGFDVTYGENLDQKAMRRTIGDFAGAVNGATVAIVFFAGHGATFNDTPYVVPVDAEFSSLEQAPYDLVPVEMLIGELRRVNGVRIAILDACRDNAAERELKKQATRGGEVSRGLAPVKNPEGLIVAYATQHLSTAADGSGANSPFTAALLHNIATPGLDVKDLFFKVGQEVVAATGRKQRPEISISIYEPYALVPAAKAAEAPGAPAAPAKPVDGLQTAAIVTPTPAVVTPAMPADQERALKAGDNFKECEGCPEMVVVPTGAFIMGSPPSESGREQYEGPQQKIVIAKKFAVGRTEVSFTEWDACLADGGCNARHPGDNGWGHGSQPVIYVSWEDAKSYVEWLSKRTGARYRLLSEAEWEYAARGCRFECPSTPFWFGADISRDQANYDSRYSYEGSAKAQPPRRTLATDSGAPNPFGLLNVHGNVREWVEDCWNANLNGQPPDGSARMTGDCRQHVLRGGSWADEPKDVRSSKRMWQEAGSAGRRAEIGFRVARDLPNARPE
jgi:formylglycine-generating enzyme required for sulfatase activity